MFFRFVFSTAARLIKLKIKFIRTIFQLNKNRRKHEIVFPSIFIQLENGSNEFYFYFYFVHRPYLVAKKNR